MKHLKNMSELRTGGLYIRINKNSRQTEICKVMSKPKLKKSIGWFNKLWVIGIMSFSEIERFNETICSWYINDLGVNKFCNLDVRVYSFSNKTYNKIKSMSNVEYHKLFSTKK